jgi:hypothetical protein
LPNKNKKHIKTAKWKKLFLRPRNRLAFCVKNFWQSIIPPLSFWTNPIRGGIKTLCL